MTALRLMTFNVHLPSPQMALAQGIDDTAVSDAHEIAKAITGLPIRERPDVIAFNEVFHEGARKALTQDLVLWPHAVEFLAGALIPPFEDSGLMLFSRFPFIPFAPNILFQFETYDESADTDQGAHKGIGLVKIDTPIQPTAIAFTHMQASYDAANSEHQQVRRQQFEQIIAFLKNRLGPSPTDWQNVVLVGDLNVKGDPDSTTSEWNEVFKSSVVQFGQIFTDGWREHMHPPGTLDERDPGYTNLGDSFNRLDYQCFKRIDPVTRQVVPHHLATPLRGFSDHWALLSRVQLFKPHTTPATAVDVLALAPIPTAPPGVAQSNFRVADLRIGDQGAYQWAYVAKPGTYSIFTVAPVEATVFAEGNLTHRLAEADVIVTAQLSSELQAAVDRRGFVPKGRTYATRTPFFVRLRWKDETSTGPCPLGILEHRGESAATAIILLPNLEVDPQLPYGQKLGQDDVCWFRASISPKFDAKPYTSTFLLRNAASVVANLTLLDEAQDVVPGIPTPPNGPEMKTELTEPLGNYFLTLGRSALTDTKFTMEWQSPLSYLRLTEPIELKIDNETGPDWPGADELRLNLGIDDEPLVSETWDDADTGESWPDLSKKIRDAVLTKLQMLVSDISFSDSLGMDVLKLDGLSAHGSAAGFIQHLHKYDKELEVRTEALTISDTFGDGQLTFKCTIAKFPSGQA